MFKNISNNNENESDKNSIINFPTPFIYGSYGDGAIPRTALEMRMLKLSSSIRLKPQWWKKIHNITIVNKWKEECKILDLSTKQFNFVIDELKYKALSITKTIRPAPINGVWESDNLVSDNLLNEFKQQISILEENLSKNKDWHPGSNNQVLDLIHPSLYCYVDNTTPITDVPVIDLNSIYTSSHKKKLLVEPKTPKSRWDEDDDYSKSKTYQWLPSEFAIDDEGKVQIKSYINNLDPTQYKNLYLSIGKIFEAFVPMFNSVLSDLLIYNDIENDPNRIKTDRIDWSMDFETYAILNFKSKKYIESLSGEKVYSIDKKKKQEIEILTKSNSFQKEPISSESPIFSNFPQIRSCGNIVSEDKDDDKEKSFIKPEKPNEFHIEDNDNDNDESFKSSKYSENTDYGEYDECNEEYNENKPVIEPDVNFFIIPGDKKNYDIRGKNVQVIVKLANIILTPESPNYDGGVWHVEGMENENIVASGIYYYDQSNISESQLEFREAIQEPSYEQGDDRGVKIVYDLENEGSLNQHLGHVITSNGRCIAFPNVYQHHVRSFSLLDKEKPGYRKILVFFLVDPTKPILSTASVPPQQQSQNGSMTLEQAKYHRNMLMDERKYFIKKNTEFFFERPFSLCEH